MQGAAQQRNTQADCVEHVVRGQGGASAITKEIGPGVTLTRTGTGVYRIAWSENPGVYLGQSYSLQAATPTALAGHSVLFAAYDATNWRLDFTVFNATPAAHDLAADEYIHVEVKFARTSVEGA